MVPCSFSLLRVPLLILRNFSGAFCGSRIFAFLSGIRILRTRLGSSRASWVVSVPGVWVLVWYCMVSCARM